MSMKIMNKHLQVNQVSCFSSFLENQKSFFMFFSHHKVWVFSVMEGAEPEPYLQECGARELRIMSLPTTLIIWNDPEVEILKVQ